MWCAGGAREEQHEDLHVRQVRQLDARGTAAGLQLRLRQQRVVVEREVLRDEARHCYCDHSAERPEKSYFRSGKLQTPTT